MYMSVNGGRSSVGRAPDCGFGGHGFEPRRSPQFNGPDSDHVDE